MTKNRPFIDRKGTCPSPLARPSRAIHPTARRVARIPQRIVSKSANLRRSTRNLPVPLPGLAEQFTPPRVASRGSHTAWGCTPPASVDRQDSPVSSCSAWSSNSPHRASPRAMPTAHWVAVREFPSIDMGLARPLLLGLAEQFTPSRVASRDAHRAYRVKKF
jgi:hypothetical protein